jgi:hypothetical protein
MYQLSCKHYVSVTCFFYRNKNINYQKTTAQCIMVVITLVYKPAVYLHNLGPIS